MIEGWVIGSGYVGSEFLKKNMGFQGTRRSGKHAFDWTNIPEEWVVTEKLLVTCSLEKGTNEEFEKFRTWVKQFPYRIFLSTTSVYEKPINDVSLNEKTQIKLNSVRGNREELLRLDGANVLSLAGIYGLNRSPISWLEKGLVAKSKESVRLIYLQDIVHVINALFLAWKPSERWVLSDGVDHSWNDIEAWGIQNGVLDGRFERVGTKQVVSGFSIDNTKVKAILNTYTFISLDQALKNCHITEK